MELFTRARICLYNISLLILCQLIKSIKYVVLSGNDNDTLSAWTRHSVSLPYLNTRNSKLMFKGSTGADDTISVDDISVTECAGQILGSGKTKICL